MRRDVHGSASLDAHVEVPPWAAKRRAVDQLLEMVNALELEGRPAVAKAAEDVGEIDQPLHQPGHQVVPACHDLRGQGPGAETPPHVLEIARLDEPGLVGEDVKAGVMELTDRACLVAVPPGQDHHVAAPLFHERRQRIGGGEHRWAPARGLFGPMIEPLHQREEVAKLGAILRIDEDLVIDRGMRDAQGQGGVEMARVEEEQRVRGSVS